MLSCRRRAEANAEDLVFVLRALKGTASLPSFYAPGSCRRHSAPGFFLLPSGGTPGAPDRFYLIFHNEVLSDMIVNKTLVWGGYQIRTLSCKQACVESFHFLCLRYHGSLRAIALSRSSPNHSYSAHFSCGKNGCILMFGAGTKSGPSPASKLASSLRTWYPGIYIFPQIGLLIRRSIRVRTGAGTGLGREGTLTLPTLVKPMFLAIALALRT